MKRDSEGLAAGCLTALLTTPLSLGFRAWVIATLWAWFVLPLGAPVIGVAHAAGLYCLVQLTAYTGGRRDEDEDETPTAGALKSLGRSLSLSAILLGFGWVAHIIAS